MTQAKEKILLTESFAHIVIREDGILYLKLMGFLKPEHTKKASSVVYEAVTGNDKLKLLLVDQKELKVLSKEVRDQLVKDIAKVNPHISRVAIIKPDDLFAVAGMNAVESTVQDTRSKSFTNEREAIEWLAG